MCGRNLEMPLSFAPPPPLGSFWTPLLQFFQSVPCQCTLKPKLLLGHYPRALRHTQNVFGERHKTWTPLSVNPVVLTLECSCKQTEEAFGDGDGVFSGSVTSGVPPLFTIG